MIHNSFRYSAPQTHSVFDKKLPKMNLGIYAAPAITTMFATAIHAQQLCTAQGCAYVYSQVISETSHCCQKQSMDFNECCRLSCNLGSPC
ncbi:PcF and SCR74-like cys-rich secreted peptide, putative [Phytophthora infestans T30-4]|uniref:PcF and SCR74-like cys-rich secreted peptide, putative n=1 Tax=Phytophthora infestans (strain T30-4) TaxID=403677 RepID=D0NEI6_PHYIT|nr:PcF and SCR74-like cys-rich secreted peptide, putative [Phytophthora infestans T30-4]EEY56631.1 PcF and SCR74-like cys-rich secreted peptide, putative [Phytophthora infestans T30-4]|eukprot:XP_002902705.1 PcF and SCR74-like cys-rich secreted peptide, putative [Phytophthora infestans T30-4]